MPSQDPSRYQDPSVPPPFSAGSGMAWYWDPELYNGEGGWKAVPAAATPATTPAKYAGYEAGMPDSPPPAGHRWVLVPGTQGAYAPVPLGQTWEENQARPVYTPRGKYSPWTPQNTAPAGPAPPPVYQGRVPAPRPRIPRSWLPTRWRMGTGRRV